MSSSNHVSDDETMSDAPAQNEENDEHEHPNDLANSNAAQKQEVKLEDLFDDEDSEDEEFPSSSTPETKVASSPPTAPV